MKAFEIDDVLQLQADSGRRYHEFLRVNALSAGVYTLPVGGDDLQQPHSEDEVYFVVSGRGMIHVAGEDRAVKAGSTVYVAAHDVHYFHSIEEELQILVFFAPAEGDCA
jgi:mannose-6-phosphate isomerase-like protein (cupin superfamily)